MDCTPESSEKNVHRTNARRRPAAFVRRFRGPLLGMSALLLLSCARPTEPEPQNAGMAGTNTAIETESLHEKALRNAPRVPDSGGVRFPTGELVELGIPRPLAEVGRKVTLRLPRDRTEVETHWTSWGATLLQSRPADTTGRNTRYGIRYPLESVTAGLDPDLLPTAGQQCAFLGAAPERCITLETMAAILLEACRIDATSQHVIRVLPSDSRGMSPRGTDLAEEEVHFQHGWLAANGRHFQQAPWLAEDRATTAPWVADPRGQLIDDVTIRGLCRFEQADPDAAGRLVSWLSAPAATSEHPANRAARALLPSEDATALDWQRAREWITLLRATGARDIDVVAVNAARQTMRVVHFEMGPDRQLQPSEILGDYPVTVGRRATRTPMMLAEINWPNSYVAWPRWNPKKKDERQRRKMRALKAFECDKVFMQLHGPQNPLGEFKLAPVGLTGPGSAFGWRDDGGVLARPTGYYIHGTDDESQFQRIADGSRTLSNGCVRAPVDFLREIVHGRLLPENAQPPTCGESSRRCWQTQEGCLDPGLRRRVCRGTDVIEDHDECMQTVPLRRDRKFYMLFGYFTGGPTGDDPYKLDGAALKAFTSPGDVTFKPVETQSAAAATSEPADIPDDDALRAAPAPDPEGERDFRRKQGRAGPRPKKR